MENGADKTRNFGKKVAQTFKGGAKPDSFGEGKKASENAAKNNLAATGLSAMEMAASAQPEEVEDDLDGARENEEQAKGFYRKTGDKLEKYGGAKGKIVGGALKKGGPALAIITILIVGVLSFGGLSMQLVSWKENIASMFGQNSAIINKRSNYIMKRIMGGEDDKVGEKTLDLSDETIEKLKERNIEYDKNTKKMTFVDPDGTTVVIDADNLDDVKAKNANFRVAFEAATVEYTGKTAGYYDSMATSVFKRHGGGNARNKLANLNNESTEEDVKNTVYKNASKGAENTTGSVKTEETTDASGNKTGGGEPVDMSTDQVAVGDTDVKSATDKLTARAKNAASAGGDVACSILRALGAINITVGAIQTANTVNFALQYLEAADKIKAGEGNDSANTMQNLLNKPSTNTYKVNGSDVELTGATTSSDGWNTVFSEYNLVDENSPEALLVNREYAMKNALSGGQASVLASLGAFGSGIAAYQACNAIQIAGGVVGTVADAVLLVTTAGIGNAIKAFIKGIAKAAVVAGAMVALGVVISYTAPILAAWLGENLESVFAGTVGGTALYSGTHAVLDSNLQGTTGVYASEAGVADLYALTKDMEEEWAQYERDTLSPFDTSSKYTFLGSIANSLTPFLSQTKTSATGAAASLTNLTGEAMLALTSKTASAASEIKGLSIASSENCPSLAAVGVAGDFACNKYSGAYTGDLETKNSEEIYNWMEAHGNFSGVDSNGNPKIKANSDYAKFIVACVANDVQPGMMSASVAGYVQQFQDNAGAVGSTLIGFVPGSGILDAVSGAESWANAKWNSGAVCTGQDPDTAEEVEYFSMYNLDQRVLEDMNIISKSSTTAFLEEYYEENPIDNSSLEGILAHYGGMNEEEIDYTLGLIEYVEYVANYNPSERYQFGEEPQIEGEEEGYQFDLENVMGGEYVTLNTISYADVRNRTYVI